MVTKPEKRFTAQECLEHKWFTMKSNKPDYDPRDCLRDEKLVSFKQYMKTQKL